MGGDLLLDSSDQAPGAGVGALGVAARSLELAGQEVPAVAAAASCCTP